MIYHKIRTIFKRDPATKHKTLLMGEYSIPEFEYLKDNQWEFTEKIDGTNIRIYYDSELGGRTTAGELSAVRIDGRTNNAQIPARLFNRLKDMFPDEVFKAAGLDQIVLYGEGFGAGIQKGGGNYISDGVSFVLFDVNIADWWLRREDVLDVAAKLDVGVVPSLGCGTLSDMIEMVRSGLTSIWGDFPAEGIVARPSVELKDRAGRRIITKLKHKDFA